MRIRSTKCVPWIAAGTALILGCSQSSAATKNTVTTDAEREAYSLGVIMAEQIRAGLGGVDPTAFSEGVSDVLHQTELSLSREQIEESLESYEGRLAEEAEAERVAISEANGVEGEAFRTAFAKDPEVITLESGLQYKVIEEGEGEVPKADGQATIHYTASKIDGFEIGNSRESGDPVVVEIDRVIAGWSEALSMMSQGAKWQLVVPPKLAYGESSYGPIGPNSTLVFELEMISAG